MLRPRSTFYSARLAGVAAAGSLACGLALGVAPRAAEANPAAEVLFREGKRLFKEGEVDEACRKFAESQRLDPTPGTLLNVAACHEKQGKSATAWAEFLGASRLADAQGDKGRSGEARRRASLLESKLSHLIIRVQEHTPGLVVKRNGEALEAALFGSRVPTDPGEHVVTAEAVGYLPFRTSVVVRPDGKEGAVDVPALTPAPKEAPQVLPLPVAHRPPLAPLQARPEASSTRRTAGYVAGGVGVAALGVGAYFGLTALSSHAKADDACPARVDCSQQALRDRDQAASQAWAANILTGVGLAGVAAGGYLLFFAKSKPKTGASGPTTASVMLAPYLGGVAAYGQF